MSLFKWRRDLWQQMATRFHDVRVVMNRLKFLTVTVLCAIASVGSSSAAVIYSNQPSAFVQGNCSFSTNCASGSGFAAQAFSLNSAATITSGSFEEFDFIVSPTSANYAFYANINGLPGGIAFFSGSGAITATSEGFSTPYNHAIESFSIAPAALGPGSYFFALQAVSAVHDTYLAQGLVNAGAAESTNGGATWSPGYGGFGGVAIALFGDATQVPEPITLSIFGAGLTSAVALRRRRRAPISVGSPCLRANRMK